MKLFDYRQVQPKQAEYLKLANQATDMMIYIAKALDISLPALHASLWVFHCNVIIMTYHKIDRYIYACGALLIGTKIMECLRDPVEILKICRQCLRDKKKLTQDQDKKQFLHIQVKKVFEAEVNIMINIGFDLNLLVATQVAQELRIYYILEEHLTSKLKQALTSLYKTEVVILFRPIIILCLALNIVLKQQGRNAQFLEINSQMKQMLAGNQIKQARRQYLNRCGML